jgi:hypothetical protein
MTLECPESNGGVAVGCAAQKETKRGLVSYHNKWAHTKRVAEFNLEIAII